MEVRVAARAVWIGSCAHRRAGAQRPAGAGRRAGERWRVTGRRPSPPAAEIEVLRGLHAPDRPPSSPAPPRRADRLRPDGTGRRCWRSRGAGCDPDPDPDADDRGAPALADAVAITVGGGPFAAARPRDVTGPDRGRARRPGPRARPLHGLRRITPCPPDGRRTRTGAHSRRPAGGIGHPSGPASPSWWRPFSPPDAQPRRVRHPPPRYVGPRRRARGPPWAVRGQLRGRPPAPPPWRRPAAGTSRSSRHPGRRPDAGWRIPPPPERRSP